ncbi:MAG: diguanylate cyclase [Lachnospiraceae bacterium]|nr:diguanylate cyclase [Lachnospiraceae bacterium]
MQTDETNVNHKGTDAYTEDISAANEDYEKTNFAEYKQYEKKLDPQKRRQYANDLRFIERIEKLISKKVEYFAYFIGFLACFVVHVLYLILFKTYGIKEMAIFNIGSVIFYAVCIILIYRIKNRVYLVYLGFAEILVHATLATVYAGWKPDFGMFILMIVGVVFLMPNINTKIPYVLLFVSLVLYSSLRMIFWGPEKPVYELSDEVGNIFFLINSIVGMLVLVYMTVIYSVINHYSQSRIRVQNVRLNVLVNIDPLTQLTNRRAMNDSLKKIEASIRGTDKTYVIGIGDIDDFKNVNDIYGHACGDTVLKKIAAIISDNLPSNAVVARWGGEEFLFVIPSTDLKEGAACAENIVKTVAANVFEKDDKKFNVTMTFGVCEGTDGADPEKIINQADKRLYKGKNSGKNRTEYED